MDSYITLVSSYKMSGEERRCDGSWPTLETDSPFPNGFLSWLDTGKPAWIWEYTFNCGMPRSPLEAVS